LIDFSEKGPDSTNLSHKFAKNATKSDKIDTLAGPNMIKKLFDSLKLR